MSANVVKVKSVVLHGRYYVEIVLNTFEFEEGWRGQDCIKRYYWRPRMAGIE